MAGFGITVQEKPLGGGRLTVIFKKKNHNGLSIEDMAKLTSLLSTQGIELNDYINSIENIENSVPQKKLKLTQQENNAV